jgi:DNA polymerase-3 subunit delta
VGRSVLDWLQQPVVARPLFWVVGNEDFLREQVLKKLRQELLEPGFAEFNHQVIRLAANSKLAALADALCELPMMTESRLLEVQQVHELPTKSADELARHLVQQQRHPGLVVVLVSETPKGKSLLWDQLGKTAEVIPCDLEAKEAGHFVTFSCQQLGLKLSTAQQQRVVERNAGGLRLIQSSLERLASFAAESRTVTDQQLDELVHDSAQVQAWRLTQAIGARKTQEAYKVLHRLLQQEPAQTLISYINSYLLGLVQVAELKLRLKTASAIARELPRRSEFQIRKSLEELASWGETDFANAFERLARADYRIKTGADPVLVLQVLILQFCHRSGR